MPDAFANANPRKRFFLEMFTRDISLQDCILDLIDNSIDGLIRTRRLDLIESFMKPPPDGGSAGTTAKISVTYTRDTFTIEDNCGGISRRDAQEEVFNFGHSKQQEEHLPPNQLGAYGIGLKRAIFKIGNHFEMTSRTEAEGFHMAVDVSRWSERDSSIDDWRFPLDFIDGAPASESPGTAIVITEIGGDIRSLLADPTMETALHRAIAQTYALFLAQHVEIVLNGQSVLPTPVPLGMSSDYEPAVEAWDEDGVQVRLIAGLAARGESDEWRAEQAGWYVLCNGRVILAADKSELTGWGAGILPQFHSSKSRGFVGIAMFYSRDPLKLPWTTTKRSLNRESSVFLRVRERMATVARPVYSFLDSLYKSKNEVTPEERKVETSVKPADLGEVAARQPASFTIRRKPSRSKTTTSVQYDAENADLELVREHLRDKGMRANQIGLHTFDYFLEQEGLR